MGQLQAGNSCVIGEIASYKQRLALYIHFVTVKPPHSHRAIFSIMQTSRKILISVLAAIAITLAILFYGLKISPIAMKLVGPINENSTLALKGYDPVAYFNEGRAIKGDTSNGIKWGNVIWYFSSNANKLAFKTFPEKYVPQYGGYCAGAVASGFTADIDPMIWHIEDDRLFLFFNQGAKDGFVSAIDTGIIQKASSEWAKR